MPAYAARVVLCRSSWLLACWLVALTLACRRCRYLVISSQYRAGLNFTPEVMNGARKTVQRLDKVGGLQRAPLAARSMLLRSHGGSMLPRAGAVQGASIAAGREHGAAKGVVSLPASGAPTCSMWTRRVAASQWTNWCARASPISRPA